MDICGADGCDGIDNDLRLPDCRIRPMCYTCILASIGFPDINLVPDDKRGDFV